MKTYLVGGAVRDKLLHRPVAERDWVVVGATPEEMLQAGFRPVGKDFPVFLHPQTHEEYALARTERKTAPGYHGFEFYAAPDVTLREDLARRDLTVNALAEDSDGTIIDYYGGLADLEQRLLRHVSPAFAEDPVRILRIARFAARYHALGFRIATETMKLMREMVDAGEVDALVPERVWQELRKALQETHPAVFFQVLRDCGALRVIFPELEHLFGVPQPVQFHPEVDTGVHVLMVLEQAARLTEDPIVRCAALLHDLGKGTTPPEIWPGHRGHEERGVPLIEQLCQRLKAPKAYRQMAVLVARYHTHIHRALTLKPTTLLKTLEALDAFRRPERFAGILIACEADARGRKGLEDRDYPQAAYVRAARDAAAAVDVKPLVEQGLRGEALAQALTQLRITTIKAIRNGWDE